MDEWSWISKTPKTIPRKFQVDAKVNFSLVSSEDLTPDNIFIHTEHNM